MSFDDLSPNAAESYVHNTIQSTYSEALDMSDTGGSNWAWDAFACGVDVDGPGSEAK